MANRVVRAILYFKTPKGRYSRYVTWKYFEMSALLTASSTSKEAYDKFLKYGEIIINSSEKELRNIESICFYERNVDADTVLPSKRYNRTGPIKIVHKDYSYTIMTEA